MRDRTRICDSNNRDRIKRELALCNFQPQEKQRKYALIVHGPGNAAAIGASVDHMLTFLAAERHYDVIYLHSGTNRHLFSHATLPLRKSNLEGVLDELIDQVTESDLVFTAFFGHTQIEQGKLLFGLSSEYIRCKEIALKLQQLSSHSIDYVTTAGLPGRLAQYLSGMKHPELKDQRHVGISPVQPRTPLTLEGHEVKGERFVTPFHYQFFKGKEPEPLESSFRDAAEYQRNHTPSHLPYMQAGCSVNLTQLSL